MPFHRAALALAALVAAASPACADDADRLALATALHRKIAQCWTVPANLPAHVSAIKVRFSLTQAGELDGSPVIEGPVGGDPASKAFAAGAIRAVVRCAPFTDLARLAPYDAWKNVVANFKRPEE